MKVYKRARLSESDQISFFIGPVPSPIIGYPCHSLTDSLTDSRLVDFIDVTLRYEVESWFLVEILKLGFVNILNFKFSRDADVWLRF